MAAVVVVGSIDFVDGYLGQQKIHCSAPNYYAAGATTDRVNTIKLSKIS